MIYHRKYRKQTKKWDASPVKCDKAYKYVLDLMQLIFEEHKISDHGLKRKRIRPQEHPMNNCTHHTRQYIRNCKKETFKVTIITFHLLMFNVTTVYHCQ